MNHVEHGTNSLDLESTEETQLSRAALVEDCKNLPKEQVLGFKRKDVLMKRKRPFAMVTGISVRRAHKHRKVYMH